MSLINRISFAAGFIIIQGALASASWSATLSVSRVSVIDPVSIFDFPQDLKQGRKLKYPFIEDTHLSFLSVDGEDIGNTAAIYTYNLADIMKSNEPWFRKPSIVSDTTTEAGFSGNTDKKNITAIFRGQLLQQSQTSGPYILKRLWSQEIYSKPELFVRDLKPRPILQTKNKILLANEKGLWKDKNLLISCQKLMNFDAFATPNSKETLILLDYYDNRNIPLIELVRISDHQTCGGTPIWSAEGMLPSFSPAGNFVAIVRQLRNSGGLTWQLQIYNLSELRRNGSSPPTITVDQVSIYDVRTDIFKFQRSYSWAKIHGKEALYFKESNANQKYSINRIICDAGSCKVSSPLQIYDTFCIPSPETVATSGLKGSGGELTRPDEWEDIIWAPSRGCKNSDVTKSKLDRIVWFSPFEKNGQINFAAQVILKHRTNTSDGETGLSPWLTRVVVLSP